MRIAIIIYSVIVLLPLTTTSLHAESGIARCVDDDGSLTYTDFLCATSDRDSNPYLMNEQDVDKTVRNRQSGIVNSGTIATSRLQSVTDEAIARCMEHVSNYVRRKFPTSSSVTAVQFNEVTDQYVKGDDVSISVAGAIEYADAAEIKTASVECTAQKLSVDTDWMVGFLQR